MFKTLFTAVLFKPLYNILVVLTNLVPGNDLGLAIIFLTVIVRLVLLPLYHRSTHTQAKMRELEPKLQAIKTAHATDKQLQAQKIMALYREHRINPFSSFLLIFIQLPIIIALYQVFRQNLVANQGLIYSFVKLPPVINTNFLGLIDITSGSLALAILVGATQFLQMQLALPPLAPRAAGADSFQSDLARSMNLQMKYVLPLFIVLIAHNLPVAISLYWITSNLFAIGHEVVVKKKALKFLT